MMMTIRRKIEDKKEMKIQMAKRKGKQMKMTQMVLLTKLRGRRCQILRSMTCT